jgi:hypothetical protein
MPKSEAQIEFDNVAAAAAAANPQPAPKPKVKPPPKPPKTPPPPSKFAWWCKFRQPLTDQLLERATGCAYIKRLAILRSSGSSKIFLNVEERKQPSHLMADLLEDGEWTPAKVGDWEKVTSHSFMKHGWEIVRDETLNRRRAAREAKLAKLEDPMDLLLQVAGEKRRSAIRKPSKVRKPRSRA